LRSLREEDLGNSAPQAWLMLLDLYQHLGMRAEFEEAAVNYAVTFEISPPSWEPQPGAEAGVPQSSGRSRPRIRL